MTDQCVVCGEIIPEGRMVCPKCESKEKKMFDYQDRFEITDDAKADWAIRKIADSRAETERFISLYEVKIQAVQEKLERTEEYFGSLLLAYMEQQPDVKATKTQRSYTLPTGKLIVKEQEPKYTTDDEALVSYFKETGKNEFIKTIQKPEWGEFKKNTSLVGNAVVDKDTGEIVPGVKVEQREPKFEVKLYE